MHVHGRVYIQYVRCVAFGIAHWKFLQFFYFTRSLKTICHSSHHTTDR